MYFKYWNKNMLVNQTEWNDEVLGECFHRYTKTFTFTPDTTLDVVKEVIKEAKSVMIGQGQYTKYDKDSEGNIVVILVDTVDSGD